jgi:AraC-like DNA-binding protein
MLLKRFEAIMQNLTNNKKRVFSDERIEFLIRNAIFECSVDRFGKDALLRDAFHQAIIYTIRDLEGISNEKHNESKTNLLCYKLMNYIDTHLYTLKSIGELSQIFKYDASYLSAIFKTTTGRTLSDYYSTRRLEHAKFLILEGNTKVWEIADMLHYSSAFSFSKAFTKKYGISPKKMQKENLNTESKKATD